MRFGPVRIPLLLAAGLALGSLGPGMVPRAVAQPATVNCDVPDEGRGLATDELRMLAFHNQYRVESGLNSLQVDPALLRAARWKASALAATNAPGMQNTVHDDAFRSWDRRITECGYPDAFDRIENLGATELGPEDLIPVWKGSPQHRENMLNPTWKYIGVARASNGRSNFWVITLGTDSSTGANQGDTPPSETTPSDE